MQPSSLAPSAVLLALVAAATAVAGPQDESLRAVKDMETALDVSVSKPNRVAQKYVTAAPPGTRVSGGLCAAPDGSAIAWWERPYPKQDQKGVPFLFVVKPGARKQPVWLAGRAAGKVGISSNAEVVVVIARSFEGDRDRLLALDLRSGVSVRDLTASVTTLSLAEVEDISVDGAGTLAAIGTRGEMQVVDIASGKPLFSEKGRFPRLSPDGSRLAFVDGEELYLHTVASGSTVHLLPGKRVMGVGGWSPDGRFLLAGAWTRLFSLEKRQIVVDTQTGTYGVIGKLGEGDYGSQFAWISSKLLTHDRLSQP